MNHRKSILGCAVGASLLAASGAAFAYVPTSNTDADVVIYWGGATASTLSAQELAVAAVCDTDTNLLYVKATSGTPADRPGNDWAVACRTAATGATKTGLPNNKRVLVVKRDRGGSGVGVGPVQTKNTDTGGGTITFLTVASCNIAVTAGVNGAPAIQLPGGAAGVLVPVTACPGTYTTNAFTEMGTSDIEGNKFFEINTPVVDGVGLPYRTQSDRAFAEERSLAALVFNHPVTLPLFTRLQEVQFPLTSVCHPSNVGYNTIIAVPGVRTDVTNGESEACMPSLTKNEINSMLTGRIVTWNQLLDSSGAAILPALPVQICRRVAGSGTQATINALTSNWPCDPNLTDGKVDIILPRGVAGPTVVLNSGSSDVDTCLGTFAASGSNPYAIGNLSVEGRNVGKDRQWRFIKIDGVAPTLRNVHSGDYTLWTQQACQRRGEGLPYNAPVSADDTVANKALVFNSLCGDTAVNGLNGLPTLTKLNNPLPTCNTDPTKCASLYTWGQSGWLATPTSALLYDNVLAPTTRPVNAYTREVTAGKVNVCQTPVKATAGANAGRGTIVTP